VYREELYVQIADANYAAMTDVDLARLEAIDA
jgi:hypothetical protein